MDAVSLTLGTSWTLAGLLCIAAAWPLAGGKVGRNPVYGVRLPQSLRSDEAWFAINRFGGTRLMVWSVPMIAVGVVCLLLPLSGRPGWTMVLGLTPVVFLLAPVVASWRFARRHFPGA